MRGSHTAREKEHGPSKEFIPPHWLVTLVWLVGFFAVWEAVAALVQATDGSDTVFPHLYDMIYWCFSTDTVQTATQSYSLCGVNIWNYLWDTLSVAVLGFLIGFALGIVFALLMSLFLPVQKEGYPLLLVSQMIPMLGLAPIFLSIFPELFTSKMFMTAYMSFFPIAALRREQETARQIMAQRLHAMNLTPDDLLPHYACAKCRDTGYLPDGRPCDCYPERTGRRRT